LWGYRRRNFNSHDVRVTKRPTVGLEAYSLRLENVPPTLQLDSDAFL
jgi:hypothetical protein